MSDQSGILNRPWWGAVGAIAAVIAIPLAIIFGVNSCGRSGDGAAPPVLPIETPTVAPSTSAVEDPVTPTSEETPAVLAESHPPSSAPEPAVIEYLEVWTDSPPGMGFGERVGENKYVLDDRNGEATVTYAWRAVRSDGTFDESETCEIQGRVEGPESHETTLSAKCTREIGTYFAHPTNQLAITTPGTYTVTVTEVQSGAEGTVQIEVTG